MKTNAVKPASNGTDFLSPLSLASNRITETIRDIAVVIFRSIGRIFEFISNRTLQAYHLLFNKPAPTANPNPATSLDAGDPKDGEMTPIFSRRRYFILTAHAKADNEARLQGFTPGTHAYHHAYKIAFESYIKPVSVTSDEIRETLDKAGLTVANTPPQSAGAASGSRTTNGVEKDLDDLLGISNPQSYGVSMSGNSITGAEIQDAIAAAHLAAEQLAKSTCPAQAAATASVSGTTDGFATSLPSAGGVTTNPLALRRKIRHETPSIDS